MRSKRAPQVVNMQARRAEVAQLRRAGLTHEQIASRVGVSRRTVISDLDHTLTELHTIACDQLDTWRSAQLSELQQVRDRAWALLDEQNSPRNAASLLNMILRAQEREARLLGLDARAQPPHLLTMAPPMTDEEAAAILAELGPL